MNLEQREIVYRSIQKLEGLLAYAVRHGETAEAERIRIVGVARNVKGATVEFGGGGSGNWTYR